jgi:hypothetical protein
MKRLTYDITVAKVRHNWVGVNAWMNHDNFHLDFLGKTIVVGTHKNQPNLNKFVPRETRFMKKHKLGYCCTKRYHFFNHEGSKVSNSSPLKKLSITYKLNYPRFKYRTYIV